MKPINPEIYRSMYLQIYDNLYELTDVDIPDTIWRKISDSIWSQVMNSTTINIRL